MFLKNVASFFYNSLNYRKYHLTHSKFFLKPINSIRYRGVFFSFSLLIDVLFRRLLWHFLSTPRYLKIKSLYKMGYLPNFGNPSTFNGIILRNKIFNDISDLSIYADKYEVRNILMEKSFSIILNELYLQLEIIDDFDINTLPPCFVMKANHGSGLIKIIKDKSTINAENLKKTCLKWLALKYNESVGGTDYHYDFIKPKIIFEKILENEDRSPLMDYKFFCFNGKVEFISVVDNSKGLPLTYVYNTEWNQLNFSFYNKWIEGEIGKPAVLKEMVSIAEALSKEFDFVRIDLYLIDNKKIIFGEYTFFPGGGMLKFNPGKYDGYYGKKLQLANS